MHLIKEYVRRSVSQLLSRMLGFQPNKYHPLVWINGTPEIADNVYIGAMSEINARETRVYIGDGCDIASFVAINAADSHRRLLGLSESIERHPITIENHVFIGSHCVVKGGAYIGHHSVVAAGTVVDAKKIPPYSLVFGNPMTVREGYYADKSQASARESGQ